MKKLLLYSLLFLSINCQEGNNINNQLKKASNINITCQYDSIKTINRKDIYIKLRLSFNTVFLGKILFDSEAFSQYGLNKEDFIIKYKDLDSMNLLLNKIRTSQIIVENNYGMVRFFTNDPYYNLDSCTSFDYSTSMIFKKRYFNLNELKEAEFSVRLNALKFSTSDKLVRLHYLFKPDSSLRMKNYKELYLTSDWFTLPEIPTGINFKLLPKEKN